MRLARWLRDPLAWVVLLSTVATVAIAALVIATLQPGLDQMATHAKPIEKPVEALPEAATPEPTALPAATTLPPRRSSSWTPMPRAEQQDDFEPRRARLEGLDRSVRRQIRELQHLRDALEREQRQIAGYGQDPRWDPEGHRLRQRRMGELQMELGRVERDLRRLERQDARLD